MPQMPTGDPWPAIRSMLDAESDIRNGHSVESAAIDELDPYWADLIRLLQVFRNSKDKDLNGISELQGRMSSGVYQTFIENRISQLS